MGFLRRKFREGLVARLIRYAEAEFRRDKRTAPTVLAPPQIAYLWRWYLELDATRDSGFDRDRLKYREIEAWARLLRREPASWEVTALMRMDDAWDAARSEKRPAANQNSTPDAPGNMVSVNDTEGMARMFSSIAKRAGKVKGR